MSLKVLFAFLTVFMFFSRPSAFSQLRDMEEERFNLERPVLDELSHEANDEGGRAHVDKELRFVAGKDNKWFTQDDEVCHYYLKTYDRKDRLVKRSYIKPGKDNIPFTEDDELQDYQVIKYKMGGKVKQEISFGAKNQKQYTAVYNYDNSGRKTSVNRYDAKGKEIRMIKFSYNPEGEVVQDEEYASGSLEKYHRFEYDDKGRIRRAVEYHVEKNGAGPDGKWFTEDDVVSSAKEYFYDADGDRCKDKKYIEAGPDGKWFTEDDLMQYYTISEF